MGRQDGKRSFERPKGRWEVNVLKVGRQEVDQSGLGEGQVDCCECGNEPSGSIKSGEFLD